MAANPLMMEVDLMLSAGSSEADDPKMSLGVFQFAVLPRRDEIIAGVEGHAVLAVLGVTHDVNSGRITLTCSDPTVLSETTGWEKAQ